MIFSNNLLWLCRFFTVIAITFTTLAYYSGALSVSVIHPSLCISIFLMPLARKKQQILWLRLLQNAKRKLHIKSRTH